MKDAELKKVLSDCFEVEPSDRQKRFIRKYRRRELKFSELLYIQLKYMWFQYIAVLLLLLGIVAYQIMFVKEETVLLISSIMPFLAIIALSGLGKASRVGMDELEMTTRFSIRMLKSIRLVLVGTAGIIAIGITSMAFVLFLDMSISSAVLFCAFPYMITTLASMILIRRWHAKENIFGCVAIAALLSVLTITKSISNLWQILPMNERIGFLSLIVIMIITAREISLYLKESEELQWNLC